MRLFKKTTTTTQLNIEASVAAAKKEASSRDKLLETECKAVIEKMNQFLITANTFSLNAKAETKNSDEEVIGPDINELKSAFSSFKNHYYGYGRLLNVNMEQMHLSDSNRVDVMFDRIQKELFKNFNISYVENQCKVLKALLNDLTQKDKESRLEKLIEKYNKMQLNNPTRNEVSITCTLV